MAKWPDISPNLHYTREQIAEFIVDIKGSLMITLRDDGAATFDRLTEAFQDSGYPTEREWVVIAAYQLAEEGQVRIDGERVSLVPDREM